MIKKEKRNIEIVRMINLGITYRDICKIMPISLSRVEEINRVYNSDEYRSSFKHCILCGETKGLFFKDKLKNICKKCVKEINSL